MGLVIGLFGLRVSSSFFKVLGGDKVETSSVFVCKTVLWKHLKHSRRIPYGTLFNSTDDFPMLCQCGKPQPLNPKSQTLSLKPKALNPKP